MTTRTDAARPLILNILLKCEKRVCALDLKGKKADDMALHYLAGAAVALEDNPVAYNWIGTLMVMTVSVRGMRGLREAIATMKAAQAERATA